MPDIALRIRSANRVINSASHEERHDREFLTAEPGDNVMVAGHIFETVGNGAQNLVANVMPMRIVYLLEVIEVEDHQPDRTVDAPKLAQIFLDASSK